jgi:hypothetical protein
MVEPIIFLSEPSRTPKPDTGLQNTMDLTELLSNQHPLSMPWTPYIVHVLQGEVFCQ